jgi:hypothetical protein
MTFVGCSADNILLCHKKVPHAELKKDITKPEGILRWDCEKGIY